MPISKNSKANLKAQLSFLANPAKSNPCSSRWPCDWSRQICCNWPMLVIAQLPANPAMSFAVDLAVARAEWPGLRAASGGEAPVPKMAQLPAARQDLAEAPIAFADVFPNRTDTCRFWRKKAQRWS